MTTFISVTDLVRAQVEPYVHLSWFLYEAVEREHRLNLEALAGTPGSLVDAWARLLTSGTAIAHPHQFACLRV
ncbi:hypothetical protein [Ideonella sp. YS5]|uniref:hypothetical protein n=1 Tax=Ideonella sp. YS5 TaxID=3453714 RepID=UPI003EEF534D